MIRARVRFVTALLVSSGLSAFVLGARPAFGESGQTIDPHSHFVTPFDKIPDFAQTPTVVSVKNGAWSDASVWSTGALPRADDIVLVKHQVVYDSTTAVVRTLAIDGGGKWSCALTQSTKLLVGTLLARPGGTLECGTTTTPLAPQFKAEIVIRDRALQTSATGSDIYDPSQYGTGVLAIDATVRMHGSPMASTFLRLAAEPLAGSQTLALASETTSWRAGDTVVVPDTRQLAAADYAPRPNSDFDNFRRRESQSETAIIQTISANTITLSTPLRFDHKGARNPDGALVILPHVGNLSRNITIRSENPTGTRGHVLLTRATNLDIRYVAFQHLGRTTQEPLDSTTFDAAGVVTHVGTNQIGRYPLHVHHVPGICPAGTYQFTVRGVAIEDGRKWAMTVHGSHYGLIQDNVIFDATGAGIATEDGSETGNVFDRNFVVKIENGTRLIGTEAGFVGTDPAGRKGNGFWFRGPNNIVRNNVVADTREGFAYYPGANEFGPTSVLVDVRLPQYKCADTAVAGQFELKPLLRIYNQEVTGNEAYSISQFGFGTWFMEQPSTGRVPIKDTTIWHAPQVAVFHKYWNGTFDGLVILNEGGVGSAIQQFNNDATGQAMHSEVHHADIQGVDAIYQRIGQLGLAPSWLFQDGLFRSRSGFVLDSRGQNNQSKGSGAVFEFRNLRFQALPGLPIAALKLTETGAGLNNYPKTFSVYSHQGNANDNFRVYYASQAPSAPAPPSTIQVGAGGGCPTAGLTNQQCWDSHKVATYGAVASCATTRQEILGGYACPTVAAATSPTAVFSQRFPSAPVASASPLSRPASATETEPSAQVAGTTNSSLPLKLSILPPAYAVLDDQLFDVVTAVPAEQLASTQSAPNVSPNSGAIWRLSYKTWEAGVIPVAFADDISSERRLEFMAACNSGWGGGTLLVCVERSSQFGYLKITQFDPEPGRTTPCYSAVGQARRLVEYQLNLGAGCWNPRDIHHQLGHALGFVHEQDRPDRDSYVSIEIANVKPEALASFTPIASETDRPGTYDFLSIMHSPANAFAIDADRPTIVPRPGWSSYFSLLGKASLPSALDRDALFNLERQSYRRRPTIFEPPPLRLDPTEFLDAMERLDAYLRSPMGLGRTSGLSSDGRPDYQAITRWIFDVYLAARAAGLSSDASFEMVVSEIAQTAEWRTMHPTWDPGSRIPLHPTASIDRTEFLDVLQRLDASYASRERLDQPTGLPRAGAPDFFAVSTWIFGTYLNARSGGASAALAWREVEAGVRDLPVWRRPQ